eukprot:3786277-Alexandrium_andersonii.AAC.1
MPSAPPYPKGGGNGWALPLRASRLRQSLLAFRVTRRSAPQEVSNRLSRRGEGVRGAYPNQQPRDPHAAQNGMASRHHPSQTRRRGSGDKDACVARASHHKALQL